MPIQLCGHYLVLSTLAMLSCTDTLLYSILLYSTFSSHTSSPVCLLSPSHTSFCLPTVSFPTLTSPSLLGLSRMKLRMRSDLLPRIIAKSETDAGSSAVSLGENDIYSINAKLKEGLLIMSREYYRSKKSVKSVFGVSYSSSYTAS